MIKDTDAECLDVLLKKSKPTTQIEPNQKKDLKENHNEDKSKEVIDTEITSDDIHSTMSHLNKHSITDNEASSHTPNKKFKHDSMSDYKLENYISEKEITNLMKKYETCNVEKRTYTRFDLNTISSLSHNIIINPESGEVESIVRKEYDKSTTPQSFVVFPQNDISLDIIQEETDNDNDSYRSSDSSIKSSIPLCSSSTQTDIEPELIDDKLEPSSSKLKKSQTLTSNLNVHGFGEENWILKIPTSTIENAQHTTEIQQTETKPFVEHDNLITSSNRNADLITNKIQKLAYNQMTDGSSHVKQQILTIHSYPLKSENITSDELDQKIANVGRKFQKNNFKEIIKNNSSSYDILNERENPSRVNFSLSNDPQTTLKYNSTNNHSLNEKVQNVNQAYGTIRRSSNDESKIDESYNISCHKCGNRMNIKNDMSSNSSIDSLRSSSIRSNSTNSIYPAYFKDLNFLMKSNTSPRNSSFSSCRNSTYNGSSDSMSVEDSSTDKRSSSGGLPFSLPCGSRKIEYQNYDVSRRFIPVRHSSYNAVNRLSTCSTKSSSSTYSTLSYNSCSSRTSQNSSSDTLNRGSFSNIYKTPFRNSSHHSNRLDLSEKFKMAKQSIHKSFSTPTIYNSASSIGNMSYEKPRKNFISPLSAGNSITDEVTNSLNELSKKYDAYIKNKEYAESSSDTNTDSTVRYVPEEIDTPNKSDEPEYVYISNDKVPTLKKLSLMAILSYKNGIDLLSNIYFVPPQKSTHLNKLVHVKGTFCQCSHHEIRLLPRKKGKPIKFQSDLNEMHQKFIERRKYFENSKSQHKSELIIEDIYSPKTPKSCIFNVDENYTKELLEEAANLLALRKYRETRIRNTVNRHYLDPNFDLVTYKVKTPTLSERSKNNRVKPDTSKRTHLQHSRLLELIQHKKQSTINQIDNNVIPQTYETKINTNRSQSFTVEKSHSAETVIKHELPKVKSKVHEQRVTRNSSRSISTNSQRDFRQVMYAEYMKKISERLERRRNKVIRITKTPETAPTMVKIFHENISKEKSFSLEEEFMQKARTRLHKLGFDSEDFSSNDTTEESSSTSSKIHDELPSHIQEFIQFSEQETFNEQGVWSPGQTRKLERRSSDIGDQQKEPKYDSESNTPIVWSPRSAPSSPINERKSYKPVKFESPTLSRKNIKIAEAEPTSSNSNLKRSTNATFATVTKKKNAHSQTPACDNEHETSNNYRNFEASKETTQANFNSVNSINVNFNSTSKLPRAQNPTITLLQKAREGQLPRGALYLDHIMNEKETRETNKRNIESNETTYSFERQYESENENSKRPKKMAQLNDKKTDGLGPTTKEGIPTVLRSDIKDKDHQKWYKQMYESLHKSYDDNDFVTVRYKTKARDRGYVHSGGGYQSEPEQFSGYNSDFDASRYATYVDRNSKNKENQFTFGTIPRSSSSSAVKHMVNVYKNQPGRIENYEPGYSSIAQKEAKQNLAEETYSPTYQRKPFSTLHGSGYESDSTLVFKRREDNQQQVMSPAEQRSLYKSIQMGGEVPLHGLRKPAPEKPKEPVTRTHDSFHQFSNSGGINDENRFDNYESPHKYAESEVTLQYKIPVRNEIKEAWSEEELNKRQAETMRRIYQEERRRKYLQELQDMSNRRHTDNLLPSQKSPIPLNRYDDVLEERTPQRSRSRTPEPKLVARALYHFTGQTSRELTFKKGDIIFVKRQIDKNWYEGEQNAMIGLFPINYVEIIPYDEIRTLPKRPSEGQARAKFNFIAQTNLELSLVKGELIVLTRRVDDNWYEGKIGNRRGIFPVSYVHVLREPGLQDITETTHNVARKPVAAPAAHSLITNQQSLPSQHNYQPNSYTTPVTLPRTTTRSQRDVGTLPLNEALHIDTSSEPIPYRALYNYKPQNEDELELKEGDTVFVMEKCDDGWYVGSSQRTSHFGTFPGNYVERIS